MPVIIRPSPQLVGVNRDPLVNTASGLLQSTSKAWTRENASSWVSTNKPSGPDTRPILRSSFESTSITAVIPYGNGFVDGIMRAFQQDLHLTLRPDDVWLAIITQFSMYINGNAEGMREQFVSHEGRQRLVVDMSPSNLEDVDIGLFAQKMTGLVEKNIKDKGLRDWIHPSFSTTTNNDVSIASIVMMGAMKTYFEYVMMVGCGFPSVTLLGEKSDWEEIHRRIERLPLYGEEPAEWSKLLAQVLRYMVASFDEPDAKHIKDFWLRVCHAAGSEGSGNGRKTLSGWITAFCFWSEEGERIHAFSDEELSGPRMYTPLQERKRLTLDGVVFPMIHPNSVPKGVVTAPVTVVNMVTGTEEQTELIAGSVGMVVTADNNTTHISKVQPIPGWWMVKN